MRGGQILPLGPAVQSIPDGHRFDALELHVRPPFNAELNFPEDDGASRAYQHGEAAWSHYALRTDGSNLRFLASAASGGYQPPYTRRSLTLVLHGLKSGLRVLSAPHDTAAAYDPIARTFALTLEQPLDRDLEISLTPMED